jgi:hypothetical protein
MKITKIEKHAGSGQWYGTASDAAKNFLWFYQPQRFLHFQEQDERNPRSWMSVETPEGARQIVLKAVRAS